MKWSKFILLSLFLSPIGVNVNQESRPLMTLRFSLEGCVCMLQDNFPIYEIIEPIHPECLVYYEGWV